MSLTRLTKEAPSGKRHDMGAGARETCCSAGLASGARVRLRPTAALLSAGGTDRGSRGNRWRAAPEQAPCFPEAPPTGISQEDRSDAGAHRPLLLANNLCKPATLQTRSLYALRNTRMFMLADQHHCLSGSLNGQQHSQLWM